MSDKNFNGYPEEDKKKKRELIVGKVIDEIRKSVRGKIKEKVTIIRRNDKDGGEYREYTPLSNSNWDHPSKNKTELGEGLLTETDIPTFLFSFGFKRTGFDNGVMFFKHSKGLDAWHDFKSMNIMVGKGGRNNKVFKGNQEKELSKYLQKKFRLKSSEPQWMYEAKKYKPNQKISKQEWGKIAKFNKHIGKDGKHYVTQLTSKGTTLVPVVVEAKARDYKAEYKKYGSSTKAKKYRAELNKYNRQKGTYGNGDKKDASHKGGKIVGFEAESKNRGRAEKSRLKKEEKLDEFNKAHFLNLIKMEIESIKGQIAYAKDKVNYKGTEDWVKKEFKAVLKDKIKDLKDIIKHYNRVKNLKEGKLNETWKKIAKKNVKYKDKWGTWNWEIESGIDTWVMGGNTPKIILHYQLEDEEGFPSSGGNTFWLKHKNGKPFTPQEAKALVNKISNKKIHDFQRKSTNPSGSGQNIYYVDGKFIREGKLTESQVAKTILQQLGGNRFIAMTGAKNLGASSKSLQMKIGRNSKSISHVVITLKSSDLYDMEFIRIRGTSRKVVKKVTGVYADMLGKMFKKYTGMNVRL